MRNFLCWKPSGVGPVINIDADFVPDEVFWAIHVDAPLDVSGVEHNAEHRTMEPQDLLAEFLSPDRAHFQLAIRGTVGAGKSHLIHWMRQNIENDERRSVVTVRRLETNLRAILDKLIDQLPKNQRQRFKTELDQAGGTLKTREAQKESLLNNLSVAIGQDHKRHDSRLSPDTEEFFLHNLPNLLLDPQLRSEKFLREGEIIDELVGRLFSGSGKRREGERLEFTKDNLPLRSVDAVRASAPAREVLDVLLYDELNTVPAALGIINRNLNDAISLSMNFSGDRLVELMSELRASLAKQGKELILLFEDLQRFQGYDGPLLNALLVQGGNGICNIRWAIACPSGFYESLPDTARTRMNAIVDMDRSKTGAVGEMPHIVRFAARYLNAVRWGRQDLKQAYEKRRGEQVASKCGDCPHRSTCHDAFGVSEDGYGLYPLTAKALQIISDRAGERENPNGSDCFNPRSFQRSVLRPVLEDGGKAIADGVFPGARFQQSFGNVKSLTPLNQEQLREKYGHGAERYIALLDLWSGAMDGQGLTPEIFNAFGLEPIEDLAPPARVLPKSLPSSTTREPPGVPQAVQELRDWRAGGHLSQKLSQTLRERLYAQMVRSIDWDRFGLQQTQFVGATGPARPFRQLSIEFERQETKFTANVPVRIRLPFDSDDETVFNRTATALEGLLEAERHGHWQYPNGEEMLCAFLDVVERCCADIVRQLKGLEGNREAWDPVAAAMELLATTAALGGLLPTSGADAETVLERCFRVPPKDRSFHDDDLRGVYEALRNSHDDLTRFVRAHCSGTKGGTIGRFLDPRRPLSALRTLIGNDWGLVRRPERLSTDFYNNVGNMYDDVSRTLPGAVDREQRFWRDWLERIDAAFGSDSAQEAITSAANRLVDMVYESALRMQSVNTLQAAIKRFESVPFSEAVNWGSEISLGNGTAAVSSCGHGDADAATVIDELIGALQVVVKDAENEITAREKSVGAAGGVGIDKTRTRINSGLDRLIGDLRRLQEYANVG